MSTPEQIKDDARVAKYVKELSIFEGETVEDAKKRFDKFLQEERVK